MYSSAITFILLYLCKTSRGQVWGTLGQSVPLAAPRDRTEYQELSVMSEKSAKQRTAIEKFIAKNKAEAVIQSAEEFTGLFEQYLDSIKGDSEKVPTYSGFADWLGGVSPASIYSALNRYPKARDLTGQLIADALVEKGIKGEWRDAVVIFTLKNRSGWTDKRETTNSTLSADIATAEETRANIKQIMKSLGYDDRGRARVETREKLDEMNARIIQLAEAKVE